MSLNNNMNGMSTHKVNHSIGTAMNYRYTRQVEIQDEINHVCAIKRVYNIKEKRKNGKERKEGRINTTMMII